MQIPEDKVREWMALQPAPTNGAPTAEELALRTELAAKSKAFEESFAE